MTDRSGSPLGYGLLGCGSFGLFCLQQYGAVRGIRRAAVADSNRRRAEDLAARFGLRACSVDELLADPEVDLIHVATPPSTHRELAERALLSGKHVLCEKPLATGLEDARRMVELAAESGLVMAANLIMRYDPLCAAVKSVIDERLLGEPLHGFFENYAKDEPLGPGHWFWDRSKSGGIFVEHGVHFFDLFRWWLGAGSVAAAQQIRRPGTDIVDQVNCTVLYGDVPVNFYHGFTQPSRMDRQEMRLLFERGSISLFEWLPTRARIDALLDRRSRDRLRALVPESDCVVEEDYDGDERRCRGRHKSWRADGRYRLAWRAGEDKAALYGRVLRDLLSDQLAAIGDPAHRRLVDESNGIDSLETALGAERLAGGE